CSFLIALTSSSRVMSRSSAAARAARASSDEGSCESAERSSHAAKASAAATETASATFDLRMAVSYSAATYLPTGFGKLNGGTYVSGHVLYSTVGGRSGGNVADTCFPPVGSACVCHPPSYGTCSAWYQCSVLI